jgi:acyl-CoA dehydrogenase
MENGSSFDWRTSLDELAPAFRARAPESDETDTFVRENMDELKAAGFFKAGVPAQLGGGGCSPRELGDMLRQLAQSCGSTALALSMHTHPVAALAWRWQRDPDAVGPFLKRIADENLGLVSSGGSDWLNGSGKAEPTEGGYLISGRKTFASALPYGDIMMTMAIFEAPDGGRTVLHFPLPLEGSGLTVVDSWKTLGMRGTGSMDLVLEQVFVAEKTVSVRRPAGQWHPAMHLVVKMALPLIYSVYLGVAEAARNLSLELLAKRRAVEDAENIVGEMETELKAAGLAVADLLAAAEEAEPGPETSNRILMGRTLAARACLRAVEKALEAAGGAGFYRKTGLERLFRDVQAARYHPLQEKAQARFAGRQALGLEIDLNA